MKKTSFLSLIVSTSTIIMVLIGSHYSRATDSQSKWNDINMGGAEDPSTSMPFYPHRANSESKAVFEKYDFEDAQVCGSCHMEIYQQWSNSMMGYAWDDPVYRALLKKASEATDGAVDYFCTGCHTPVGLTTGQINSEVNRKTPNKQEYDGIPGIDCEACHNMNGRTGIDNGAFELSFNAGGDPVKFGPREDAVSPYHDTAFSKMHSRSDFCGTCHNVTHPFNNVPIERTYDEWLESSYAKEGVDCQDCHMKTFKGKAAVMGPERADVASHYFSGANSTVLRHMGSDKAAEKARQMLQTAASIKFENIPKKLQPGALTQVVVKVENIGAGHKLPTGFPEGREIWIDFSVTDATGFEVYRSGRIVDGKTEPNTRSFKVHLGDKDGKEVDIEVWTVTHIISDNRILPKGYDLAEYDFLIPIETKPPYTITAILKYWPFPQALVDSLLGPNKMKVDVVELAEISETLK